MTSVLGEEAMSNADVNQHFGKHFSCHPQGDCVLVVCSLEALKTAGGRW